MSGASRALHRTRQDNDEGELAAVSRQYDRNACQWRTVSRMIHVMREAGFLNVAHRGSEWLTNVFSCPPTRMTVRKDQDSLLSISAKGEITAQLHASVLFPDVFGPLSDEDRKIHFNDRNFKKWTKCRAVIRPGQSMRKAGGGSIVEEGDGEIHSAGVVVENLSLVGKRPRSKNEFTKIVQDRRRRISKIKDAFYEEQTTAVSTGNIIYLKEVMARRDALHASRYLISPFADCFLDHEGKFNHGAKSRFLKYAVRDNRDIIYPMNDMRRSAVGRGNAITATVSAYIFDSNIRSYLTVQLDVMNALHYRGNTGDRGTALQDVITGKMKSVLRHWITGPQATHLRQIHLHVDDPNFVLSHKTAEQAKRDAARLRSVGGDEQGLRDIANSIGFNDELNVPWSTLLRDRGYKDELASLHLFCGAVAACELLQETAGQCAQFAMAGVPCIPGTLCEDLGRHVNTATECGVRTG